MWIWLILILMMTNAYAANPYKLGEVSFFHHKEEMQSFDWQEPQVGSDGQVSLYTPPEPVYRLLESPSEANAKAYIAWQRQKVQKIINAQRAIESMLQKEGSL
jgi:hypothetical protein